MNILDTMGIDVIELGSGFPVGAVNCYLVYGEKLTLIDTGSNLPENMNILIKGLEERELTIHDIDQVLLTHHHLDHVGLLERILEVHPIPVLGHPNCRPWLKQEPALMNHYLEFSQEFLTEFGAPSDLVNKGEETVKNIKRLSSYANLDIELNDSDNIPGLPEWKVIETKGHAQSHLSFFRKKDGVLLAGDHIIDRISSNARIEPPLHPQLKREKSLIQYIKNLKKCAAMPIDTVLSGHGSVVKQLPQYVDDRVKDIEKRLSRIKVIMNEGYRSGFEIALEVFGSKITLEQLNLVSSEIVGHLDILIERDEIYEKKVNGVRFYRLS
ncbi:MBL fold metallo-hydrolase [Neobacillus niacini]|uniref:MBL fold metallo-hydrolase n=1 Tax=Neobacillus niacini TaxID=86668 RepID=UPI002FFE937E